MMQWLMNLHITNLIMPRYKTQVPFHVPVVFHLNYPWLCPVVRVGINAALASRLYADAGAGLRCCWHVHHSLTSMTFNLMLFYSLP